MSRDTTIARVVTGLLLLTFVLPSCLTINLWQDRPDYPGSDREARVIDGAEPQLVVRAQTGGGAAWWRVCPTDEDTALRAVLAGDVPPPWLVLELDDAAAPRVARLRMGWMNVLDEPYEPEIEALPGVHRERRWIFPSARVVDLRCTLEPTTSPGPARAWPKEVRVTVDDSTWTEPVTDLLLTPFAVTADVLLLPIELLVLSDWW